jgi:hypothetical protein
LLALIPLPPAHAHHLDGRLPPSASCKERKCIPLHTPACEKDIEWEKLRGNVSQLSGNRHQSEFQPNDPPAEAPPPAPSATGLCGCVGQLVAGSQRSAASGGTAPGLRTPTGFTGQRKARRRMVTAPTPAGKPHGRMNPVNPTSGNSGPPSPSHPTCAVPIHRPRQILINTNTMVYNI